MKIKRTGMLLMGLFVVAACTMRAKNPPDFSVSLSPEQKTAIAATNQAIDEMFADPTQTQVSSTTTATPLETATPTRTSTAELPIFADLFHNAWGREEAERMWQIGAIRACQESPELKFCPKDTRTRLEHMLSIAKLLGIDKEAENEPFGFFKDLEGVSPKDEAILDEMFQQGYYPEVFYCKLPYLVDADRYFCPFEEVHRAEAFASAVLIALGPEEFAKISNAEYIGFFKDLRKSEVISGEIVGRYAVYVERAVTLGIYQIGLRPPDYIDPGAPIKKIQDAVLLDRALELLGGVK